MLIIPAIDLKDGKCVRLLQGREDAVTVYSENPVLSARQWESCGAKLLHVVDLDGAFTGSQKNLQAVRMIRESVAMEMELGGGIRDMEKIDELVEMGIHRVILGTVAIEKPALLEEACKKYPGKIIVGIDARDGKGDIFIWLTDDERRVPVMLKTKVKVGSITARLSGGRY